MRQIWVKIDKSFKNFISFILSDRILKDLSLLFNSGDFSSVPDTTNNSQKVLSYRKKREDKDEIRLGREISLGWPVICQKPTESKGLFHLVGVPDTRLWFVQCLLYWTLSCSDAPLPIFFTSTVLLFPSLCIFCC